MPSHHAPWSWTTPAVFASPDGCPGPGGARTTKADVSCGSLSANGVFQVKTPSSSFLACLVPAQGASPLAPRLSGTSRAPVGGVSVGSWYLARRLGVRAISPLDRDTKGPSAVGIYECTSLGLSMHQSWTSDVSTAPAISCSSPVSPRCLQATGWPWGNDTGPDA